MCIRDSIDYDPSATKVNQENRIKLMLSVAKEELQERLKESAQEKPAAAPAEKEPAAAR